MKARQLIHSAVFGPDAIKAIGRAFDEAWQELAPTVSQRGSAIEAARLRLATIILGLAKQDTRNSGPLKDEAVRRFRLKP